MRRVVCLLFAMMVLATAGRVAVCQQQCDDNRIMKVDVVDLIDRRTQVEGSADLSLMHAGFMYLFVSKDNLTKFRADPSRYEIQLDGACARMGARSGRGTTSFWATHQDKLYIFASEACRDTFKSSPDRLIDGPDPVPHGDDEAKARGRELVERAVTAIGGEARLDALITIQIARSWSMSDEEQTKRLDALTLRFPHSVHHENHWAEWRWVSVAAEHESWSTSRTGTETMGPCARRALQMQAQREVASILRARRRPDFVAIAIEPADVTLPDGRQATVQRVATAFDETTTVLGLDAETGSVLSVEYRDRGPTFFLGEVQATFGDFRDVGGLTLPHERIERFEGRVVSDRSGSLLVEVDQPAHLDLFKPPQIPAAEAPAPPADAT